MYYTYETEVINSSVNFKRKSQISLAGCNKGIIPQYLRKTIPSNANEPLEWKVSTEQIINELNLDGNTIIIDAKPKDDKEILLFELKRIIGYSYYGWTPILIELQSIINESINEGLKIFDKKCFSIQLPVEDIVRSFLYLRGSVKNGQIIGKWLMPGPSNTNGALLWPKIWNYFIKETQIQ